MKELIYYYVTLLSPILAGFITSILIPLLIKKISVKIISKKIDDIDGSKEIKEVKDELKAIRKEIFEIRGIKK